MYQTISVFLILCSISILQAKTELMVSAAASLKNVFTEIAATYEKEHPEIKIALNFAGSGQLQSQIEMSAPVDIFASASQKEIKTLKSKNLINPASVKIFAQNEIVLIKNKESKIKISGLADLKKTAITSIAIGSQENVPAGRYTIQSLEYYKLFKDVKNKLIPCENVRQVLDYVERNEVDAGFVFATDAVIGKNIEVVEKIMPESHEKIVYPLCIIKNSAYSFQAAQFIDYIMKSKSIFKKYGFKE